MKGGYYAPVLNNRLRKGFRYIGKIITEKKIDCPQ